MKYLFKFLLIYMFFLSNFLFAQNSKVGKKIKSDSIQVISQSELALLIKSGELSWSKSANENSSGSNKTLRGKKEELDSLIKIGVLKWSELRKKQDTIKLKNFLESKIIQWSENKTNLGIKTKNDN